MTGNQLSLKKEKIFFCLKFFLFLFFICGTFLFGITKYNYNKTFGMFILLFKFKK